MPLVMKELQPPGRHIIEFELDEREYAAIGRAMVQWAYLEQLLYAHTKAIASAVEVDIPPDAIHADFKRRLAAFRILAEQHAPASKKKALATIVSKIANLAPDRHRIAHGMWEINAIDPERLDVSSIRPKFEFEKSFDFNAICKFGTRVGAISGELQYPNGMSDVLASHADEDEQVAYGYASRKFKRAVMKKEV